MTCGFEDQSIDTGRFVLSRINNENYQFHHIRFDCIQGEQGELVFEPSDVEYYFEPVTIQESGTSILKNELENSEDGAGQVGFQLSNDGTNEIQYGKSNYYSFQGNDSNLLIVFYVQIMPDDFVMQLHRF